MVEHTSSSMCIAHADMILTIIHPPFGHNRHESKIGWGGCALFSGGSWAHIEHNVA